MKVSLIVIVVVVAIVAIVAILGLMPALLPGGPTTPIETTPTTTPITTPITTPYTIPTTPPTTTTPLPEEEWIETFEEFIDLVRYMKWELESYDRTDDELIVKTFYYYYRGIEVIDGVEYTKIEFIIKEDNDTSTVIIWLPKKAEVTPKVMINGEEVPPHMAEYAAQSFIVMFMNFFVIPSHVMAVLFWPYPPPEIGTLTRVSLTQITYGNVTLSVDKWVFTPNPNNPNLANITKVDIWVSIYKGYRICVYFRIESTTVIETYKLLEIY